MMKNGAKILLAENTDYSLVSFFGAVSQRAAYELNPAHVVF